MERTGDSGTDAPASSGEQGRFTDNACQDYSPMTWTLLIWKLLSGHAVNIPYTLDCGIPAADGPINRFQINNTLTYPYPFTNDL